MSSVSVLLSSYLMYCNALSFFSSIYLFLFSIVSCSCILNSEVTESGLQIGLWKVLVLTLLCDLDRLQNLSCILF